MVALGWYTSLSFVLGISHNFNATTYGDANARSLSTGIEYMAYAWGPIMCAFILAWALVSASRYDAESEVYR